jgi:lysophospholipase L1-like esterase
VLFRAGAVLLSLLFCALAAEGFVRLCLPRSFSSFRDASTDWQPDARLGWVQKPNLDLATPEQDGILRFRTNGDGLTPYTASREKSAGVARIMIFGDSTAVGRSVPPDQTVNAHLERALQAAGVRAEVLNAGVEGYSTDQELLRMEDLLPVYSPDVVLLVVCENDFGANTVRGALGLYKPAFQLTEDGSLQEIAPLPNDAVLDTAHSGVRKWLRYSALYRALAPRLRVLRAKFGPWEERSSLGLGLVPEFYYRPEALDKIDWELFGALLRRMNQSCGSRGVKFIFYAHPSLDEVWDSTIEETIRANGLKPGQYDRFALEQRLRAVSQATATDFCPLIDYFAQRQDRGPFHLLPRDPHCNPAGYQVTAEALAEHLLRRGYVEGHLP